MVLKSKKNNSDKKRMTQKNNKSGGNTTKNWYFGTAGFMVSQKKYFETPELNIVEINSTFYRLPTERSIKSWNNFPKHLKLSIKVSKYITHLKRLHDCKEGFEKFWNIIKNLSIFCGNFITST